MKSVFQKSVSGVIAGCLIISQLAYAPSVYASNFEPADAPEKMESLNDLVVLVVDSGLDKDKSGYIGLQNEYSGLGEDTLGGRILRYAEDLRESNEATNVKIVFFDSEKDSVDKLAIALEKLYRSREDGILRGAVLIGDVPLPVINKSGARYVSLLPYTDFDDKGYVYNADLNSYEAGKSVEETKPEIWHGVIDFDSKQEVATFFDKNHLFYSGNPAFAKFDRKMFFGDMVNEEEMLNADVYQYYLKYLESSEDLAYMRFNKEWAKKLLAGVEGGQVDPELLNSLPDIHAKQIIDQYLMPYYRVLSRFNSQVNDFADNTGRYEAKDVDSLPTLISIKDEQTKEYLKSINDALETKVNEVVQKIEEPIYLLEYSDLSGIIGKNAENNKFQIESRISPSGGLEYINSVRLRYHYFNEAEQKLYVNGVKAELIENPLMCSLLQGSTVTTKSSRATNQSTAAPVHTLGINSRVLSKEEGYELTDGKYSGGAVIEDNKKTGVPAFWANSLRIDRKNVGEIKLKKGDVIKSVNGKNIGADYTLEQATEATYGSAVALLKAIKSGDNAYLQSYPYEVKLKVGSLVGQPALKRIAGNIGVDFYRDGTLKQTNFTFTVDENGKLLTAPPEDAGDAGSAGIILFAKNGIAENFDFDKGTEGAIFTMNNISYGYDESGYDVTAGCFYGSSREKGSRCLAKFAQFPVKDPGGAIATTVNGDLDEAIYNACFSALPAYPGELNVDSNQSYTNVIDPKTFAGGAIIADLTMDLYGRYIEGIGKFVAANKSKNAVQRPAFGLEDYNDDVDISGLSADKTVLHKSSDGKTLTLADFSSRYGIFDGADNDGDGIRDYRWLDKDSDGVFETREVDLDEAKVGIPNANFDEIARKMFSRPSTFVLPASLSPLGEEVTLKVNVKEAKKMSSMIVHNEPSKDTISSQVKSQTAQTLPIDEERYVTFQLRPAPLPAYPAPDPVDKNPPVDVESILANLTLEPHYFAGKTQKIFYPNSFDFTNYAQLESKLISLADEIAKLPGSFRVFGESATAGDYSLLEIRDEILAKHLMPVINGAVDEPPSGLNLKTGSKQKIYDAYNWSTLSIDDKHEYALKYYLNPEKDAFVADSPSGYEAAYLAFNGDNNYIDTAFNKDPALSGIDAKEDGFGGSTGPSGSEAGDGEEGGGAEEDASASGEKSDFEFVWLDQFLKELGTFAGSFTSVPEFGYMCVDDGSNSFSSINGAAKPAGSGASGGASAGPSDSEAVNNSKIKVSTFVSLLTQIESTEGKLTNETNSSSRSNSSSTSNSDISNGSFGEEISALDNSNSSNSGSSGNSDVSGNAADNSSGTSDTGDSAGPSGSEAGGNNNTSEGLIQKEVKADTLDENEQKKLKQILKEIEKNGENNDQDSGANSKSIENGSSEESDGEEDKESADDKKAEDDGKIKVLLSEPLPEEEIVKTGDVEVIEDWEDYFFDQYYQQFLKSILEAKSKRYLVEMVSDQPVNPFVIPAESVVADGKSIMQVNAYIGESGKQVRFSVVESDMPNMVSFVEGNVAESVDGEATVYMKAGKKAGKLKLKVEVLDGDFGIAEKELYLVAGQPHSVKLNLESNVMVANGQSKVKGVATVYDVNGNRVNNNFNQVGIFVSEKAKIDSKFDFDKNLLGTQLQAADGTASFEVTSGNDVGLVSVVAVLHENALLDDNLGALIGDSKNIDVVKNLTLSLLFDKQKVVSGGENLSLKVELLKNGKLASGYNGPINLKSLNGDVLDFVTKPPAKMDKGILPSGSVLMSAGLKSGSGSVLVEVPGFVSAIAQVEVAAGNVEKISLTSEEAVLKTGQSTSLFAELFDKNDNLVVSDTGSIINFKASEKTKKLVNFSATNALTLNGKATTTLTANSFSGTAKIQASTDGATSEVLDLNVKNRMNMQDIAEISPRALYLSVAGGNFEKIVKAFLSSSESQVASGLTAGNNDGRKLFAFDSYGRIDFLDPNMRAEVLAATQDFPYQKVALYSDFTNTHLADLFVVPKINLPIIPLGDTDEIPQKEGIYFKNISGSDKYSLVTKDDGVYFNNDGETKVKLDKYGRISVLDKNYILDLPQEEEQIKNSGFTYVVRFNGVALATVVIKNNFGSSVEVLPANSNQVAFAPGVYIRKENSERRYEIENFYSGSSTAEGMGVYLVDKELDSDPQFAPNFVSGFGTGFKGSDKHMLLFSAGSSVGESNLPYLSEVGIIYGDPMVRLEKSEDLSSELSGFTKDIGESVYSSNKEIVEMIPFDYNGDGEDDILLAYEDGLARVLEKVENEKDYLDRGIILDIFGGIVSLSKIDVNNDGYDDLVAATKDSCKKGDTCLTLYTNEDGRFKSENLDLNIAGKPLEVKARDMNLDGCEDLVVSDSSANIRIFYNKECSGLNKNYGFSSNFGFAINPDINTANSIFVNYPGMAVGQDASTLPLAVEVKGVLDSNVDQETAALFNELSETPLENSQNQEFTFLSILEDTRLGLNSNKKIIDVNGGNLEAGDRVNYVVTLSNGGGAISGLRLSDLTADNMSLDQSSLKCLDAGCSDKLKFVDTGTSGRNRLIEGITVPSGGKRNISYSYIVNEIPAVDFELGNNFGDYTVDAYGDILVRPSVNPENLITYLYSNGLDTSGQVKFSKVSVKGNDTSANAQDEMLKEAGLPGLEQLMDPNSAATQEAMTNLANSQNADKNFDGLPDSFGGKVEYSSADDKVANAVKDVSSLFRCSGGGCLPSPYNYAFFAPDGATPGVALMAFGTEPPPFFAPFYPSNLPSAVRLYLCPTLTMGLGTAVCVGPDGNTGVCFAGAIPLQAMGACPDFLNSVNDAIAGAKNALVNPDIGMASVISNGNPADSSDAINKSFGFSDPSSPVSAAGSVNVKIPGFPSVVTNWLDNQAKEIFNKLLDLPDFYFIYPDFNSLVSDHAAASANFNNVKSMQDFLKAVNSLPLVQIESKEVSLRIPVISQTEVLKWQRQADAWIRYHEEQIQRIEQYWKCDESEENRTLCDKFTVHLTGMIKSVKAMMSAVDQLSILPQKILNWKNAQSKYASQIICYLDAVMNYTGGYINRQQKIVQSWMKAVEDTIKTFKDWKVILNISADYQASCDQCKSDRFGKLGLLMNLFVTIPDLPIIPFPKWPDIVFDVSQLRTGVKIVWPDLLFVPEKISLPNIPVITIPEVIPEGVDINLQLPEFGLPEWTETIPNVELPELPDLPALPLPKLPDLPRPPKIPQLPDVVGNIASSLKPIFKILCLLKNGLIPIPETSLATEIETLTQPSVQAVLPFIKGLGIQMPAVQYSYVDQIRINAKLNMGISTDFIYRSLKAAADAGNVVVKEFVEKVNSYTSLPAQKVIDDLMTIPTKATEKAIEDGADELNSYLPELNNGVEGMRAELEKYIATMEKVDLPEQYNLVATEEVLTKDDPRLNRSLADIEKDIASRDLPDMVTESPVAQLRDTLISYVKDSGEQTNLIEGIKDYEDFTKIIVEASGDNIRIADTDVSDSFETGSEQSNGGLLGEDAEKSLLIAANIDVPEGLKDGSLDSSPEQTPKGLYIIVGEKNENVLNYTDDLSQTTHLLFDDVDNDDDNDLIYATGGDVYVKENYKESKKLNKGELIITANSSSISDIIGDNPLGVTGVNIDYKGNKKIDLSWDKNKGAVNYEVLVLNKPDAPDSDAVLKLSSDKNKISINLANGIYYARIYSIDENGLRSLASEEIVINPQICNDVDSPMPVVSQNNINLALFKEVDIDASGSFDPSGEIVEYYLESLKDKKILWSDLSAVFDSDGDGNKLNDKNNPKFRIGPFEEAKDVGLHEYVLHVVDQSGNESTQKIKVNVYVPAITLDSSFSRTGIASGETIPKTDNAPVNLFRKRLVNRVIDGGLKLVPEIKKFDKTYYTNENGSYQISDLSPIDMILVKNFKNEIVAEINPITGNVGALVDGYKTVIVDGEIRIMDSKNTILGFVKIVSDPNVDVKTYSGVLFDKTNTKSLFGTHVSDIDTNDQINLKVITGKGLAIADGSKALAFIDTAGNFNIYSKEVSIAKKSNSHITDPLVFELKYNNKKVVEIFIATKLVEKAVILAEKDVPNMTIAPPESIFIGEKANEDLNDLIAAKVGVINKEGPTTRKEFVEVLLKMLCIVPRPEAYTGDSLFSDMEKPDAYIKEAALLGLIDGYVGEVNEAGISPFKPLNNINRAEAVKIILRALEYRKVIALPEATTSGAWYVPFVKASENLTPYFEDEGYKKSNFIITAEEGAKPNEILEFDDLMTMASRVLDFYNCSEIDENANGVSDYCEQRFEVTVADGDDDVDGLTNIFECEKNTDPKNADSDGGGVNDSLEILSGANPLNPLDDKDVITFEVGDNSESNSAEPGVYIIPAECNTCPCISTFEHKADIMEGDVFYTKISDISKSNEVVIESITNNKE